MPVKTEINKDSGEQFVLAVIPLMKEYTQKLELIVQQADSLHESFLKAMPGTEHQMRRVQRQLQGMSVRASRLSSPVIELNRRVSQMIEHGQLDSELDRVELKLRLAELENATDAALQIETHIPSE